MESNRMIRRFAGAVALALLSGVSAGAEVAVDGESRAASDPIVIAHRGASAERPEHTLEAYRLAIEQGADFIEPDLVSTKDGVLIARHENEIGTSTDVAEHPEFAGRRTTKSIDGVAVTGWFSEDFTLAEIKTLRARQRLPQLRSTAFDGRFAVPTLQEILDLVAQTNTSAGRSGRARVGIYPETKHPSYFASIGLALEEPLVKALDANGLRGPRAPVFIQSFEVANLKRLRALTEVPLVQLIADTGQPYDFTRGGDPRSYADMIRPEGLAAIAVYAQGIGVHKNLVLPRDAVDRLLPPTTLIRDAHRHGLVVHAWTFRAENTFLPDELRSGLDPRAPGDLAGEVARFLRAGVDGLFADHVAIAVEARDGFVKP
jgi:glycerophosphoryl diester phosphodiesterase